MPDYILRVEGVNFGDTVFNTTDLSTIRGSSMCLEAFGYELEAALADAFKNLPSSRAEKIYSASAQAVFKLSGVDERTAHGLTKLARDTLAKRYGTSTSEPPFVDWGVLEKWENLAPEQRLHFLRTPSEHMTFVVTSELVREGRIREAVNRAMWRNRCQQMRVPNLPRQDSEYGDLVCPIDPLRNVAKCPEKDGAYVYGVKGQFPEEYESNECSGDVSGTILKFKTSRRSADLRTYGRDARRTVYAATLGSEMLIELREMGLFQFYDFSQSFRDLIAESPDLPISVKGKIAFIYFDGTGFGDIRAETDLEKFSNAVQHIVRQKTRNLLTHFIRMNKAGDESKSGAYGLRALTLRRTAENTYSRDDVTRLRVETLLQGGEDLLIAVPSWLAWDITWRMLGWFREAGAGAVCDVKGNPRDMIFRAGLLICDEKTPARRATAAAHAICDDAKKALKGVAQPVLGFHIAEGFDVPELVGGWEDSISRERRSVFCAGVAHYDQVSAAFRLQETDRQKFESGIAAMKAEFARSQLYKLIREVDAHPSREDPVALKAFLEERLQQHDWRTSAGMTYDAFLGNLPGPDDAGPLVKMKMLAEIWDYVQPLASAQFQEPQA